MYTGTSVSSGVGIITVSYSSDKLNSHQIVKLYNKNYNPTSCVPVLSFLLFLFIDFLLIMSQFSQREDFFKRHFLFLRTRPSPPQIGNTSATILHPQYIKKPWSCITDLREFVKSMAQNNSVLCVVATKSWYYYYLIQEAETKHHQS
ncbi:hypothetical protein AAHE18_10G157100 [Arachis hypogaea]